MGKRFVVAAYELGLAYGGPEEGGWYYGTGSLEKVLYKFKTKAKAESALKRHRRLLEKLQAKNKGLREVSSVLYSGGRYGLQVHREDKVPKGFPEYRPYYE